MPTSALFVANNILSRAFDENVNISLMKLQRLLYFTAAEYAKKTHTPLFHENFEAWPIGPVLRTVYDKFGIYAEKPIKRFSRDAMGNKKMVDENSDEVLHVTLNKVWRAGRDLTAADLAQIAAQPDSAYTKAWFDYCNSNLLHINAKELESDTTYTEKLFRFSAGEHRTSGRCRNRSS